MAHKAQELSFRTKVTKLKENEPSLQMITVVARWLTFAFSSQDENIEVLEPGDRLSAEASLDLDFRFRKRFYFD